MQETVIREIPELLKRVDDSRRIANGKLETRKKSRYSQYMTPANLAVFMASLFPPTMKKVRLLDPGAGVGILTSAFLANLCGNADEFEIDPVMRFFWSRICVYVNQIWNTV